jgi:hypothetical protein
MAGALLQLVAYGAQDLYITGQPQITFFKVVYRRYTNFAMESIEQTFNGSVGVGRRVTVTVSRSGDLLGQILLEMNITVPANLPATTRIGFELIDNIELEIGGQVIDRHYGEWMAIWTSLTLPRDKAQMLDALLARQGHFAATGQVVYVPLQFWFCNNPGLALPLIALQYHEVKLNITFKASPPILPLGNNTASQIGGQFLFSTINSMRVWCDYVFLDTDERRRFAQMSHEYLIEQVQTANPISFSRGLTNRQMQTELYLNHPTKCLVWVGQQAKGGNNANDAAGDFTAATGITALKTIYESRIDAPSNDTPAAPNNAAPTYGYATNMTMQCRTGLLQFNGTDRFKIREGSYFTQYQRFKHFDGYNSTALTAAHIYSFALKPGEHQPSGTCNFSRIDSAVLLTEWWAGVDAAPATRTVATSTVNITYRIYGVNYNILRIVSGMGGVAYSN